MSIFTAAKFVRPSDPVGVKIADHFLQRRARSAALAVGVAAGTTAAAWLALGFAGLRQYPNLLGTLASVVQWKSYSIGALALGTGLGSSGARSAEVVVGGALIVLTLLLAPSKVGRLLQLRRDPLQDASIEGCVAQEWPKNEKRGVSLSS